MLLSNDPRRPGINPRDRDEFQLTNYLCLAHRLPFLTSLRAALGPCALTPSAGNPTSNQRNGFSKRPASPRSSESFCWGRRLAFSLRFALLMPTNSIFKYPQIFSPFFLVLMTGRTNSTPRNPTPWPTASWPLFETPKVSKRTRPWAG